MSLLVTGSIGIDTLKTPFGVRENCLGGSAVYFSMAASFLSPVRFVGVVGDDCPFDLRKFFAQRPVDLAGLEVRQGSKTFRWAGSYQGAMNEANTDAVALNVLAEAPPRLPEVFRDSQYVFLANTHPALQLELLQQLQKPRLVVADTMNLWINNERTALVTLLGRIDGIVLNDGEARLFTGVSNLVAAGREVLKLGPQFVVIKKGEHGAILMTKKGDLFVLSAYLTEKVVDPTGAGDSFAGGLMGYLARRDNGRLDIADLRKALAYGTVIASFVIEDFSLDRWQSVKSADIDARLEQLREMMNF